MSARVVDPVAREQPGRMHGFYFANQKEALKTDKKRFIRYAGGLAGRYASPGRVRCCDHGGLLHTICGSRKVPMTRYVTQERLAFVGGGALGYGSSLDGELPRWPFTAMFALFPLWWFLGPGDMAWIPFGVVMVGYMWRRGGVVVPRSFWLWLMFLVLMSVSVIGIDSPGRLIGFVYRAAQYATFTAVFVYVYNARERLTVRYVLGVLTVFWGWTVVGGYASIAFPSLSFDTLMSYVLPHGLLSNELVSEMATRRLTQHKPDGWLALDPRPSAPFLYTNAWGNVYSMLLPAAICYLRMSWGTRRSWFLLLATPLSVVPAFLTLNRGMFLGMGVAFAFIGVVALIGGQRRLLAGLLVTTVVLLGGAAGMDVTERVTDRTEVSTTTENRADLYQETFERTLESPLFGYGAPRPSVTEGAPSAGTQGQIWTVMFSHGFPALFFFLAWLAWTVLATLQARDPVRIALTSVLLVILVESSYYGVATNGLILAMAVAGLLMRPARRSATVPRFAAATPLAASLSASTPQSLPGRP